MASRRQRFNDEAAAAALVRYGPELSGLRALIGEADQDYRRSLHQSQAGQASTQRAVATAMGQLRGIYGDAPIPGLAGLGRTQAMESMTERGLLAAERAQSARTSALEILRGDRAKIAGRRSDIAQEIGAFTASEAGKLSQAAAQRSLTNRISLRGNSQSERNSIRSSGIDPDTGLPIPGGKLDPKAKPKSTAGAFKKKYGVKLSTPNEHGAAKDRIDQRLTDAKAFAKAKLPRSRAAAALVNGIEDQPVLDENGKQVVEKRPDGSFVKKKKPGVKAQGNNLWTSIALDLAYDGFVSGKNATALHKRGYSVEQLGLRAPSAKDRQRRRDARLPRGLPNPLPFG